MKIWTDFDKEPEPPVSWQEAVLSLLFIAGLVALLLPVIR